MVNLNNNKWKQTNKQQNNTQEQIHMSQNDTSTIPLISSGSSGQAISGTLFAQSGAMHWPATSNISPLIYKKMSEVMKDIGYVGKDQKNTAQGFKFRGIDDLINALYPALTKHEVFVAPKVISYTQELKEVTRNNGKQGIDKHVALMVEYTFWTTDGSSVTLGPIASEGLDSGDKSTNKALSAALKYALIQGFMVPTMDVVDGDRETPEIGTPVTDNKNNTVSTEAKQQDQTNNAPAQPTGSFRKPKNKASTVVETPKSVDEWE